MADAPYLELSSLPMADAPYLELSSLPMADAPYIYMHAAWTLCCFHSLISTHNFCRALTALVDKLPGDKECPFSGVTSSGRVWRKVPESDAGSVASSVSGLAWPGCTCIAASTSVTCTTTGLQWNTGHRNHSKSAPCLSYIQMTELKACSVQRTASLTQPHSRTKLSMTHICRWQQQV